MEALCLLNVLYLLTKPRLIFSQLNCTTHGKYSITDSSKFNL